MMEAKEMLQILKQRFQDYPLRHQEFNWLDIENRLLKNPEKIKSLIAMEQSKGEPDVIFYDGQKDKYLFTDCCLQSPSTRRSLCYDQKALKQRKKYPPAASALQKALEMGTELLDYAEYQKLQQVICVDTKTSSWVKTPLEIRELGGALFAENRYQQVFLYHNSAQSYYQSRGFRVKVEV